MSKEKTVEVNLAKQGSELIFSIMSGTHKRSFFKMKQSLFLIPTLSEFHASARKRCVSGTGAKIKYDQKNGVVSEAKIPLFLRGEKDLGIICTEIKALLHDFSQGSETPNIIEVLEKIGDEIELFLKKLLSAEPF